MTRARMSKELRRVLSNRESRRSFTRAMMAEDDRRHQARSSEVSTRDLTLFSVFSRVASVDPSLLASSLTAYLKADRQGDSPEALRALSEALVRYKDLVPLTAVRAAAVDLRDRGFKELAESLDSALSAFDNRKSNETV